MRHLKEYSFLLSFLFILGFSGCYKASKTSDQTAASPSSLGFDVNQLNYVDSMMTDYLETKRLAGGVYLIARKGQIVREVPFGNRDRIKKIPQRSDDLFRIASMTKPITAIAAMQLLERGKFGMEDPLWWHLPEFRYMTVLDQVKMKDSTYTAYDAKNEIRVKHLFNHTSGIGYGFQDDRLNALYVKAEISEGFEERPISLEENVKRIASMPLMHEPGENWTYGLSYDVLGRLIEVLSKKSLDQYLSEHIFEPLEMRDTHFYLPEGKEDRLSSVYESSSKGVINTTYELTDYPIAGAKMYYSGGADLTCTARDYARFAQMVMNGGELNGNRVISKQTIKWMTDQQTNGGKDGIGWGFGVVEQKNEHKTMAPVGSNYWGGFFGTQCLMDPENELIAILMIQQYPNWEWNIHDKFHNIIYASLTEEL
jgi:CubicO group peptidase (beta-lactamase class C family)